MMNAKNNTKAAVKDDSQENKGIGLEDAIEVQTDNLIVDEEKHQSDKYSEQDDRSAEFQAARIISPDEPIENFAGLTIREMLYEGINASDIADAIKAGKFIGIDRIERQNQVPQNDDLEEILVHLERFHHKNKDRYLIGWFPFENAKNIVTGWLARPLGVSRKAIDRYFLKLNNQQRGKTIVSEKVFDSNQLLVAKAAKNEPLKKLARDRARRQLQSGTILRHHDIAKEIFNSGDCSPLSQEVIKKEVLAICKKEGFEDNIYDPSKNKRS